MVDDETLFKTMQVAAETGALVMVHAENGDAIDVLVKEALAAGQHRAEVPRADPPARDRGRGDQPRDPARPRRRLRRSTSSTSRARSPSSRSRSRARRAGTSRARPARSTSSSTTRSWSGRTSRARSTSTRRRRATRRTRTCSGTRSARDMLSAISTDHCAFRWDGQKSLGKDDFSKIPNGGPGLENRLHMIHQFGVREGRIALNRMVELLATNPAKLFGLYPRKGTIAVGSDADIVVFDPRSGTRSPPRTSTRRPTTTSTRARRSPATRRRCSCAATCWSRAASSSRSRGSASSSRGRSSASSSPRPERR